MKRHPEELVSEIYNVQKNYPIKDDFYDLVMQDLKSIDLNITEDAIIQMKKEKFKSIVKKKVRESALC